MVKDKAVRKQVNQDLQIYLQPTVVKKNSNSNVKLFYSKISLSEKQSQAKIEADFVSSLDKEVALKVEKAKKIEKKEKLDSFERVTP